MLMGNDKLFGPHGGPFCCFKYISSAAVPARCKAVVILGVTAGGKVTHFRCRCPPNCQCQGQR